MKSKIYQVSIDGATYLVEARTMAGAARDVVEELAKALRAAAIVDLATGEQLYQAGQDGAEIINSGAYKRAADPNQMSLPNIPETSAETG